MCGHTHLANCFFFAALIFFEQGVIMLSVGEWNAGLLFRNRRFSSDIVASRRATYMPFAILFSRKALAPIPGA